MNGATAEPLVSTINPPKRAITMKTGKSQNFFRTLRKVQNSFRKLAMNTSELVLKCFGSGPWRFTGDPIAVLRWLEPSPHGVLAGEPHQEADWGDTAVK